MILVVDTGSSSVKAAVFDASLTQLIRIRATRIGGQSKLIVGEQIRPVQLPDHAAALQAILEELSRQGFAPGKLTGIGHRVVHGGTQLIEPCRITPATLAAIKANIPLAPLHNPNCLAVIRAMISLAPDLPQTASFDTAFHATNPAVAVRYAIPADVTATGIRRYGFHGLSFAGIAACLPERTGQPLPVRLLALHLGNGASLCAIRDGKSVATTMGYSPVSGLTMGTRSGDIDAVAVLRLAEAHGIDGAEKLLNRKSGLKGLGGHRDMRVLAASDSAEAAFAIRHFCYWAVRHAGSMIAAMGGLDAIVFTGGIGENADAVRAEITGGLGWLGVSLDADANRAGAFALHAAGSSAAVYVLGAEEERMIARDALAVLQTCA